VRFTLDTPAMVGVFIADDHIRKIIHKPGAKGANEVVFTPGKDWGDHILVHIAAGNADAQIILPMATSETSEKESSPPEPVFDVTAWTPPTLTVGDTLDAELELKNNDAAAGVYKYAFYGPNLKIQDTNGSVTLAEDQSKNIGLTLHATMAGAWPVKLEITGPHGFHMNRDWIIDVRTPPEALDKTAVYKLDPEKSWSPAKPQTKHANGFLFVAPQPLFDAPHILELALAARPIATNALADRLEMLRLWHDDGVKAGFLSEQSFIDLRDETAVRLLQRQKTDGSFPILPNGESDLVSTAAALMALAHIDAPYVRPGSEQADGWLKHKLDNSWFDEHERPFRAAALALMAEAGKVDAGTLHYFSDTSANKTLPPLAEIQLALAFAKINDHDKALYWLNRAGIKKDTADLGPEFLLYLADNVFSDAHELLAMMGPLAAKIIADPSSHALAAPFLRALATLERRDGGWRVTINGAVQNANSVLVLSAEEKITAIANPNNDSIFIEESAFNPANDNAKTGITRHIYRLDGGEAGNGPFTRGETYIVTLEGEWPDRDDADKLLVFDDPGPGLSSLGCMIDGAGVGDALGWIKNLNLASLLACEKPEHSLFALIGRRNETAKSWRVAYLATAEESGTFSRNAAHAFLESEKVADETVKGLIRIRK
jgi:hypothetical protein